MTLLVMLLALLTGAALQALLPSWRWMGGAQPPLLLALVLFYAFAHSRGWMLLCALLAGLLQDALGQVPLGFSSFCFGLVGFTALYYRDDVEENSWAAQAVFGGLAAAAVNLLLYILLRNAEVISIPWGIALRKTIGSALLGAALTPLAFRVVLGLERQLGERPVAREGVGR